MGTWICAGGRDNPEVGDQLSREQLYSLPHASFSLGSSSLSEVFFQTPEASPRVRLTSNSFVSLPFLLRGTSMVAMLQRRLALRLQDAAEIRLLEPPVRTPKLRLRMWWSAAANDPAQTWLRAQLAQAAKSLA